MSILEWVIVILSYPVMAVAILFCIDLNTKANEMNKKRKANLKP